jgi:hypothetical protein
LKRSNLERFSPQYKRTLRINIMNLVTLCYAAQGLLRCSTNRPKQLTPEGSPKQPTRVGAPLWVVFGRTCKCKIKLERLVMYEGSCLFCLVFVIDEEENQFNSIGTCV